MTRKPNFAKFMLGITVLAILFIGTWAATTAPSTSAKKSAVSPTAASNNPKLVSRYAAPLAPPATGLDSIFSVFELEGDIVDNPAGAPDDWSTVNCGGGNALIKTGVVFDGLGKSIYTGGGSKDPELLSSWQHKDGSVPPKDEILNAYAAKYSGPTGDDILIFGADRYSNNGTAFIGIWFFQDSVVAAADGFFRQGPLASDPIAAHTIGDVLVLVEFTGGGSVPTAKVFDWVGTGGSEAGGTLNDITGTNANPDAVFSISNALPQAISSCPAWVHTPKSGPLNTIQENDFFEGGINLNAFPALAGTCFSSFLVETRSSAVVTATLKDFVLGQFNTCVDVSLTKTATDVCEGAGASGATTYTYTVKNEGGLTTNFTLTDDNETNPYTSPFTAAQIGADDLDVGGDNNCAPIPAGGPTSFSLAPGASRIFICTQNQSLGTHTNTAQATASFSSSTKTVIASATAHVYENPAATAGANQSVCELTASHVFNLVGTGTVPTGGSIQWSGTGIVFGSPNSFTTTATVSAFGTFTATLTVTSPASQNPSCPQAQSSLTLILSRNPTAAAGPDQDACEATASHVFNLVGTGTVPAGQTITWSGTGIVFGSPNALATTATVSSFGSFTATMTVSNTATGSGCIPASDSLTLVLNQNPTADAGPDQTLCSAGVTTPFTLAGSATNGTTLWTCLSGDCAKVSITTPTSLTSGVVFNGTGSATLRLTTTSAATPTSCGTDTDEVVLTVDPNPTVTICGDELCSTDEILALRADVTPGTGTITYLWSGPAGGISGSATGQTISVVLPGTYTVSVTRTASGASSACPGSTSMHVGLCPGGVCGTP